MLVDFYRDKNTGERTMARIITTFDHTLKIPPHFKKLTGKEWYVKELKAGEATEVPDHIAAYYTANWATKYKYADAEEVPFYTKEELKEKEKPKEFEAIEFLETNYDNIEDAVNAIEDRGQILEIAKVLKFSGHLKQSNDRLKARIISDITVKKEHEAELAKKESAKE